MRSYKFILIVLLGAALLVATFVSCTAYHIAYPEIGLKVQPLSFIPPEAADFSYIRSPLYAQYYFKLSEEKFLAWIATMEFSNDGYEQRDGSFASDPKYAKEINLRIPGLNIERIDFDDGHFIAHVKMTGGGYRVGYNRQTNAVVYDWTSH